MKNTLKARIESILGCALLAKLEQPRDKNLAHYAMPVFVLAKELKKAPPQIATEIAEKLNSSANDDLEAAYESLRAIFISMHSKCANFEIEEFCQNWNN